MGPCSLINSPSSLKKQSQLPELAQSKSHQEIQPVHLARAILEQPEGVVVPVFQKMGVDPAIILMELNRLIDKIPQVSGGGAGQVYLSAELKKLLDKAFSTASQMQDEFVSQEHLFLTILKDDKSEVSKLLRGKGVEESKFLTALTTIRGNQRVTDQYPEDKYQALEKYARNLTDTAKGKAGSGYRS